MATQCISVYHFIYQYHKKFFRTMTPVANASCRSESSQSNNLFVCEYYTLPITNVAMHFIHFLSVTTSSASQRRTHHTQSRRKHIR